MYQGKGPLELMRGPKSCTTLPLERQARRHPLLSAQEVLYVLPNMTERNLMTMCGMHIGASKKKLEIDDAEYELDLFRTR
jgi:hypothetical protein